MFLNLVEMHVVPYGPISLVLSSQVVIKNEHIMSHMELSFEV